MKNTMKSTVTLTLTLALVALMTVAPAMASESNEPAAVESTGSQPASGDTASTQDQPPVEFQQNRNFDSNGDGVITFAERLEHRPGLMGRLAAIRAYLIRLGLWTPVPVANGNVG